MWALREGRKGRAGGRAVGAGDDVVEVGRLDHGGVLRQLLQHVELRDHQWVSDAVCPIDASRGRAAVTAGLVIRSVGLHERVGEFVHACVCACCTLSFRTSKSFIVFG